MLSAKEFVDAQLYPDERALINDALRHLLRVRPELRIDLAVHRYRVEGISLAKGAELAGVSWAQMREIRYSDLWLCRLPGFLRRARFGRYTASQRVVSTYDRARISLLSLLSVT